MEREDDVQLIHAVLSGDDAAFDTLVEKYQKSVHALAWRKIGDFHYAEEITQDTFLRAYQNLSTLRNPNQFLGWLYVIANRLCLNWLRKHKPANQLQSLEDTPMEEVAKSAYAHYVLEQREIEATEHRFEIVKKLLEKLPESERTVMTLYYLGEMTTKEIGKFLGVSVETIRTRMHRARKRLQKEEQLLIQEVLGGVQIPASIRQNIMREVIDMKPTPSPKMEPFLPWVAFGTAVVVATLLMLSASNQYLTRFQRPYSFEAESEPTVEIIDAPIVLDIVSKPAVRNRIGRAVAPDENRRDSSSKPQEIQLPQKTSDIVSDVTDNPLVVSRMENRSFPSVFQAWDDLIGSIGDKQTSGNMEESWDTETLYTKRLTKHDLHWSPFFGLWWDTSVVEPTYGLSTRLGGELEAAKTIRQQRLSRNPNMLFFVEVRIHNHVQSSAFPPDSDFWLRDSNNRIIQNRSDEYVMDFLNPDLQDLLIQRIVAIDKCGIFDGVMIAGFHSNATVFIDRHFHDATDEEIITATTRILREARTRVRDDFLILVNTNPTKPIAYAEYVNGTFMVARRDSKGNYTRERLQKVEETLLWAETQLRAPQINCLEGWGIGTSPPDSPENMRWVRVFTTLSLTHSDGYVLYTDGRHVVDSDALHHSHYWYPFWDADLGQPISEKAKLYENQEGLFIREFTNGWVVYNRSGKPQKIQLPMQVTSVASGITATQHTISDLDGEIYLK
ncbi:MAG: sigma-70 family RNA polymerase sigma factor [Candidatus Poribacteria bacterium]|nr:sigma-70 family RNA polymerase sigma factor [Candidatus Poribacteria bacterium]